MLVEQEYIGNIVQPLWNKCDSKIICVSCFWGPQIYVIEARENGMLGYTN